MSSSPLSVVVPSLRKQVYEAAWRHRGFIAGALVASLCGLGLLGLSALGAPSPPGPVLGDLALALGGLAIVSAALWLALPAWFSPAFQLFAWRTARLGFFLRSRLRRLGGHRLGKIVITAPFVIVFWAVYEIRGGGLEVFASLAGIALLATFVSMIWLSRRQIFVTDFTDCSAAGLGGAIASRLRNELASIAALYDQVDEALPQAGSPTQGPALSLGVQDRVSELGQTIGRDFQLKWMGFEIPIGGLMAVLGGWFRGPRLSGSLHLDGEKYVLIAEISGGGKQGSWRVSQSDLPEAERGLTGSAAVYRLVEQLAYRIVTGLKDLGSPRWEAVRAFTDALRAHRKVQRTRKDYHLQLRKAERSFISALSEDDQFAQCYYNLGVVYLRLGQDESAEAAFRRAIEADAERFDAYRALATCYYKAGDARNAEIWAEKALGVDARRIEAWNLRGLARGARMAGDRDGVEESFALAAALAWRRLCRLVWQHGAAAAAVQETRDFAAVATGNLAEAQMQRSARRIGEEKDGPVRSGARRSAARFRHALRLRPHDPFLYLSLGKALLLARDWPAARDALLAAFGEGLDLKGRPLRWACLAVARYRIWQATGDPAERDAVRACRQNFLHFIVPPEDVVLGMGLRSQSLEFSSPLDDYLEALRHLQDDLEQIAAWTALGRNNPLAPLRRAVRALDTLERSGSASGAPGRERGQRGWLRAQALVHAARSSLAVHPDRARRQLGQAIAMLEESHFRQIEKQGLNSLLALAMVRVARPKGSPDLLQAALGLAEKSVRQEPLSPARRWVLTEVYSAMKDSRQLFEESRAALDLGSVPEILGNPEALSSMAEEWFRRAAGAPAENARRAELEAAFHFFDHVRDLIESEPIRVEQPAAHAALHFWLGRFRCELLDCVQGVGHLEIARAMGYRPIQTRLILGQTYAGSDTFAKAKQAFREAAYLAWKRVWAAKRGRRGAPRTPLSDTHRPDDLLAEALLRLALLYVKSGICIRQAGKLAHTATTRPGLFFPRRVELRALVHEVLGRVHLADGKADEALEELRQALALQPSAEAWSAVAATQVEKVAQGTERASHVAAARQACDRAERLDVRGTCRREIADTKARLLELGRPAAAGTAEVQAELVF
jgi:tetratricopeptide (TPR) repeat protein